MNTSGSGVRQMLVAAVIAASACSGVHAQDTKSSDKTLSSDKTFLTDAAEGNLAEINYAKLALQKSGDKNVREFATKMIKDHEMLNESMKPFAKQLGVKEPSGPPLTDHVKYEELKMKSGIAFDRAYVEAMVKDHHDDLQAFIDEENKTADPALKAETAKGEAVIREHTEMIDKIAHMGGIETPPMPTGV
jgi:putative membrane protein